MSNETGEIIKRAEFSRWRLDMIRDRIRESAILGELPRLCIYVTGSFGRLEASEHSDLDVFFMHEGSHAKDAVPRIRKTLLDADLIRAAQELGFPQFSNDGQYLQIHYIDDILHNLGGPEDDFKNHFTARLLLLLESRPLHNPSLYRKFMKEIIDSYYRDYPQNEDSFRPVFLTNDIIRFWRTMCLNYEHRRNRPDDDELTKNKNHVVNLKLKFSRLVTCYATIALISISPQICPDELLETFALSPFDRLNRIGERLPEVFERIQAIASSYSWFLEATNVEKGAMLEWIGDQNNRQDAFTRGRAFGSSIYDLLRESIKDREVMRFLVV